MLQTQYATDFGLSQTYVVPPSKPSAILISRSEVIKQLTFCDVYY